MTRSISNKEVIRTLCVSLGVEFPSEQEQLKKADVRKHILFIDDNPQFAAIPVVFLSSIAKKEHIKEILQLQPAGYILKPADKERILNMITQTLGK